jgi:uncharacterized membrane protein (UPF0136 family)
MRTAGWITFIYGLIILIGGVAGHLHAKSYASLIAGTVFGVLLLICAIGIFKDHLLPAYFGILLTFFLDAFFSYRWLFTFAFIPAGLMSLISTAVFIAMVLMIRKHLKAQRKK